MSRRTLEPDEFVPFQKQRIRRILENEVYLGHIIWGNAKPKGRKSASVARRENVHEPIIAKQQFGRVQRQLNQNRKRRTNTRYARGRQSPLKGLIRCACGCHMVAKEGTGRNETHHYYGCTRRNHEGKDSCNSPAFRADTLEAAVINRLKRISTTPEARQRIAQEALRYLGDDAQRIERELGLVRQRLGTVQTEINNLTKAIARMGAEAAELVEEELVQRKQERDQLRGQAAELEREKAPRDVVEERAKRFVEQWSDIGQLLEDAKLEEQRVILQHLIEVLELKMVDHERKRGTYLLKLFPEVGRLVSGQERHASAGPADEPEKTTEAGLPRRKTGSVLTEKGLVRQFGQKAPRGVHDSNRGFVELGAFAINRLRRVPIITFYAWNAPHPVCTNQKGTKKAASDPLRLARYYQSLLDSGEFESRAALARFLGVSRARVTQVLKRLNANSDFPTGDSRAG